jgi:hypothetical protein
MDGKLSIELLDKFIQIHISYLWVVVIIIGVVILFFCRWKKHVFQTLVPVNVGLKIGGIDISYKIFRNEQTMYIAHRIYLELMTRIAAHRVDPKNDMIIEIYDSWYDLFKAIRSEIKDVPGKNLYYSSTKCEEITNLALDVLNAVIRPHLTAYQADFRAWWDVRINMQIKAKSDNVISFESPKLIQAEYEKYKEIIEDIQRVNDILIDFAAQLYKIAYGKPKHGEIN